MKTIVDRIHHLRRGQHIANGLDAENRHQDVHSDGSEAIDQRGPLGGGRRVEAAFSDNWTARVEYLFVDLQNASYTPFGVPTTVSFDGSLIRAGLDYKFR